MADNHPTVRACPCCGLVQSLPPIPPGMRASCARCGTGLLRRPVMARTGSRTAAVATAALLLYPFAVSLPIMKVQRLGHANEASILEGIASLLGSGQWVVGLIVLLCSIVFPLTKLLAMLLLSTAGLRLRRRHRAVTYRVIEWTGRWGMLDVLLVAVLVAVLKLGDIVEVAAGPAALAFGSCVVLSLVAAACFDPHSLWESEPLARHRTPGHRIAQRAGGL